MPGCAARDMEAPMTRPAAAGARRQAPGAAEGTVKAQDRAQKPQDGRVGSQPTPTAPSHHKRARSQESGLPQQTEREFQASVINLARGMGWTVWFDVATNAPRRCSGCGAVRRLPRNASGHPDLILIRRPRIIWAELKAEDGKLSEAQAAWIEELMACGQEAYVWRPQDAQRIAEVLVR